MPGNSLSHAAYAQYDVTQIASGGFLLEKAGGYLRAEKLGNGYVFFGYDALPGDNILVWLQASCSGICVGPRLHKYTIGSSKDLDAAPIRARVGRRGVYSFGSYALKEPQGGFIVPGAFKIITASGPSKRQMLEVILKFAPEMQREIVRAELARL